MTETPSSIWLGTRSSPLARWQTDYVQEMLRTAWPRLCLHVQTITTQGDRVLETPLPMVGGKGLFTAELEAALRSNAIDLAVHSLKDLPTHLSEGLAIGAVIRRADPRTPWSAAAATRSISCLPAPASVPAAVAGLPNCCTSALTSGSSTFAATWTHAFARRWILPAPTMPSSWHVRGSNV